MRTFALLVQALLALPFAGCCSSSNTVIAMERTPEDTAADCEEICERALVPQNMNDHTVVFLKCDDGSTEEGAPAALCTFVDSVCPR
jgi:hypothetical protein